MSGEKYLDVLPRRYKFSTCAEKGSITGGTKMPIRRYVEEGVFSSEALSVMGKAFEAAIWTLGPECDETKREAVAKFIIQLARNDDSLDVAILHRRAVTEFGSPIRAVLINDLGYGLPPPSGAESAGERGAE
jgi:hypothetical protein